MKKIFLIAAFGLMGFIAKAQDIIDVRIQNNQAIVDFENGNRKQTSIPNGNADLSGFNSRYVVFTDWGSGKGRGEKYLRIWEPSTGNWNTGTINGLTVRSVTNKAIILL